LLPLPAIIDPLTLSRVAGILDADRTLKSCVGEQQ
jgi:hypothetical protein